MAADNNTAWIGIGNSPIYSPLDLNVSAFVARADGSGNLVLPNITLSSATQNAVTPGVAVFSEAVNLGQVGIIDSPIFAARNGVITVAQLGSTSSSATNLNNSGNAYSGAVQNLEIPYGTLPIPTSGFLANAGGGIISSGLFGSSDISIGRQGTINVSVNNAVGSQASVLNGSSTAGENVGDWGVAFPGGNPLDATAGGALAFAAPGNTFGLFNVSVDVGGGVGTTNTLNATLTGNTQAIAKVGDASGNGGTGDAFAQAGLNGFYNDQYTAIASGGGIDIGGPGGLGAPSLTQLNFGLGNTQIIGRAGTGPAAPISVGAQATTRTGDATANAFADQFGGITQAGVLDFDPSGNVAAGLQIQVQGNAQIEGTAKGQTNAVAITDLGNAQATSQVNEVFGIVDNNTVLNWDLTGNGNEGPFGGTLPGSGSAILVGGSATVAAGASVASNAFAQAGSPTDPSGGSVATTDNNFVVGLALGGISDISGNIATPGVGIVGDANLRVFADSTQRATAIGGYAVDPSGVIDPLAISAEDDVVAGILATDVQVGGNLTSLAVSSQLNAQSNAFSVGSSVSTAESGNGSLNAGIQSSSVQVQGDANYAYVPSNQGSGNNYTADPSRQLGPINVYAQTNLQTYSGTTGVAPGGGGYDSVAVTGIDQLTAGINDSYIEARDATIISQAATNLGATAGVVYPVDLNGNVDTDPDGAQLAGSDAIAIVGGEGGEGAAGSFGILDSKINITGGSFQAPGSSRLSTLVQGNSTVNALAQSVTEGTDPSGALAASSVSLDSGGISLDTEGSAITIRLDGNIDGTSAVLGGSFATNYGTSGNDDADAEAFVSSGGLFVGSDSNVAVGRSGSINGVGILGSGANPYTVFAESSTGDSTANGEFDVFGISAAPGGTVKPGGLSGNVTAQTFVNTAVSADAESGAANATNSVSGIGISVPTGLDLAGGATVSSVNQVFNTVTAFNQFGTANALANTAAVGIQNTPISFNGTGTVFAVSGGSSQAISGIG